MSPLALLDTLEGLGVRVTLTRQGKVRLEPADAIPPELLAAARANRDDLARAVAGAVDSGLTLPFELEALLRAACAGTLPTGSYSLAPGLVVPDLERYTLAAGASSLLGDRERALAELWAAYRAWQGRGVSA